MAGVGQSNATRGDSGFIILNARKNVKGKHIFRQFRIVGNVHFRRAQFTFDSFTLAISLLSPQKKTIESLPKAAILMKRVVFEWRMGMSIQYS
jgi:hypothetical protein